MRLRLVGGSVGTSVGAWHEPTGRWVPILDALSHPASKDVVRSDQREVLKAAAADVLTFLRSGPAAHGLVPVVADRFVDDPLPVDLTPRLPFAARSLRPFLLSARHSEQLARAMVARYLPDAADPATSFERPMIRATPLAYQGNHNALVPDGVAIDTPPYGHDLDYELEIGFVVTRDVRDATEAECRNAIGGLVILNDLSLRDTQWQEAMGSPLGPVNKCKSFATAMSSEVLITDESVDDLSWLTGTVHVDGGLWATGRADDLAHSLPACLARLSEGETVRAGEMLSTGTLAGCSGVETGRLPPLGAEITLTVDQIGRLSNRVGTDDSGRARHGSSVGGGDG